jgi:hypothetical protein
LVKNKRQEKEMMIYRNPSNAKIRELITLSSGGAASWIEEKETGDLFYWSSDSGYHKQIAKILNITAYEKGIAIEDR